MDAERLDALLTRFRRCRVAVLGDFFLDKYLEVDPALQEVSLETGKPAHQVVSIRCSPGAAGTVVNNLAALAAGQVHALGFTGDDGEGYELGRALRDRGCETSGLFPLPYTLTPTYLKPRDLSRPGLSGEGERYDTKNRRPTPAAAEDRVLADLARLLPALEAVVVIDQVEEAGCGVVTTRVRTQLSRLAAANPGRVFWADSRCRIGLFRDMIVKVNAREAVREALGAEADVDDERIVQAAVDELGRRTAKPVFVTAGSRGIWVGERGGATRVPAVAVDGPLDPTGAGDSATAGAVLALAAGATLREAALLANLVASITIQQLATTGIAHPSQLGPRLDTWRSQTSGESPCSSRSTTSRT